MASREVSSLLALALALLPGAQAAAHGSHGYKPRGEAVRDVALPAAAAPNAAAVGAPDAKTPSALPAEAGAPGDAAALGARAAEPRAQEGAPDLTAEAPAVVPGSSPLAARGSAARASAARSVIRALSRATGAAALWGVLRYPVVVRDVDELLDRGLPSRRRARAALELGRLARPETAAALALAARDGEPDVARAARRALRAVPPPAPASPAPRREYAPPPDDFDSARRPVHYEALKRVVGVSAVFTLIEAVGSWYTGSVSLQADAMHLAADLMINVGTLYASFAAMAGPTARNTFGSLKLEPMIGLLSAIAIAGMGLFTGYEALERFMHPAAVPAVQTMVLALSGLASNAISTALLFRFRDDSLSLKGAFIHAATDAIGSLGIIVAGALILGFGWLWADPLITLLIVGLILRTTWDLAKRSWSVLLDAVPEGVDVDAVEKDLLAIPGVLAVRDLHVWALNSSERAAVIVLRVSPDAALDATVAAAKKALAARAVGHTTVELTLR